MEGEIEEKEELVVVEIGEGGERKGVKKKRTKRSISTRGEGEKEEVEGEEEKEKPVSFNFPVLHG